MSDNPHDIDAKHIIEIVLSDRNEAERLYERLQNSELVMMLGGTLSLRSYSDASAAAWRGKDEEIAFLRSVLEGFSEAIKQRDIMIFGDDTARTKIEQLEAEIVRLCSCLAALVEAARELVESKRFPRTTEEILADHYSLVEALAEYDAASVTKESEE